MRSLSSRGSGRRSTACFVVDSNGSALYSLEVNLVGHVGQGSSRSFALQVTLESAARANRALWPMTWSGGWGAHAAASMGEPTNEHLSHTRRLVLVRCLSSRAAYPTRQSSTVHFHRRRHSIAPSTRHATRVSQARARHKAGQQTGLFLSFPLTRSGYCQQWPLTAMASASNGHLPMVWQLLARSTTQSQQQEQSSTLLYCKSDGKTRVSLRSVLPCGVTAETLIVRVPVIL